MIEEFYSSGKGASYSFNASGAINQGTTEVFNGSGAYGGLVNTEPKKGFKNASGRNRFMRADGDTAASTSVAAPAPAICTSCLWKAAMFIAVGTMIGYFIGKKSN